MQEFFIKPASISPKAHGRPNTVGTRLPYMKHGTHSERALVAKDHSTTDQSISTHEQCQDRVVAIESAFTLSL